MASREVRSAVAIGRRAGVLEHRFVRLPDLREAGDLPGAAFEGLPSTYIPMRNAIFYSFAASVAEEVGASAIVGGHNKDDALIFEDVRRPFFMHLERALLSGSARLRNDRLRILRPLSQMSKTSVLHLASSLGVPLELTWSCHKNGYAHCWRCPGCASRKAAFSDSGLPDPLSPRRGKLLKGTSVA